MTDVQVSNARRIGFTAAAVVAFWIVSWQAYTGAAREMRRPFAEWGSRFPTVFWNLWGDQLVIMLLLVAVSSVTLLALSRPDFVRQVSDPWVVASGLLCGFTSVFSYVLAEHDFFAMMHGASLEKAPLKLPHIQAVMDGLHHVSWFLLLLPIILTTAFVIFGAWRRAVRDAGVEASGEDE